MKTDRDAWQALALLGVVLAVFLAAVLVLEQVFATPFDGARAALVLSVALICFAPMGLWLERRPVVTGGPHWLRRRMRSLLGLLAIILSASRPPDGTSLGEAVQGWAIFLVVLVLFGAVDLARALRRCGRRRVLRRMLPSRYIGGLLSATVILVALAGHDAPALTPAQIVWMWLVFLGVACNVMLPGRLPRAGASPLGRRVLLVGEVASSLALILVSAILLLPLIGAAQWAAPVGAAAVMPFMLGEALRKRPRDLR